MPFVLLISAHSEQLDILKAVLPDNILLTRVETVVAARQIEVPPRAAPCLILADTSDQPDLTAFCIEIRLQEVFTEAFGPTPVILLISSLDRRAAVLNAGANDYLLLPFCPAEVTTRLAPYLRLQEISQLQDESRMHGAQMAFIVLISRLIGEQQDLGAIFAQTLEQTVSLLNAGGGEIWLFSEDEQYLDLASSLFPLSIPSQRLTRRRKEQGLIGWASQCGLPLIVTAPAQDPHFDSHTDPLYAGAADFQLLAIQLHCPNRAIGVLVLYKFLPEPMPDFTPGFSARDAVLLENIAPLVGTAIANAQAIQALHHSAEQQRVLYEMSQQIAAGLDLPTTLNRAIQWISRLSDVEIGLIWLVDESQRFLRLAAALGVSLPSEPILVPLQRCKLKNNPRIIQEPCKEYCCETPLFEVLNLQPRNTLAIPMLQRGQRIGIVTLFDKVSGLFTEADLTLLSTATEMISISVGNAREHARTLALMEERERYFEEALQNERLRTMGRLTASLAHEINNPMQAIRGALTLALEELNSPDDLRRYIELSQQETDRVVRLVNRMRQIYRPQADPPESVHIPALLRELLSIAREETLRLKVKVQFEHFPDTPPVVGVASQLHLAFLSIVLNLADAIGALGGGDLLITTRDANESLNIQFLTNAPLEPVNNGEWISRYGLSLTADILAANRGTVGFFKRESQTILKVELPTS